MSIDSDIRESLARQDAHYRAHDRTVEAVEAPPCEHEFTVTEIDNWGVEYTVCEDCEKEVEPDDNTS